MHRIVGIDQAILNSGVAMREYYQGSIIRSVTSVIPSKKLGLGAARAKWIKDQYVEHMRNADLLVIEGRTPERIKDALGVGMMFVLLEVSAFERDIPVLVVYPTSRIAYMGKGLLNTKMGTDELKAKSIELARSELLDIDMDDNQADALWLAEIGCAYLGLKEEDDPKREEVIANLLLTPEQRKIAEQDRKLAEADRIRAQRAKPKRSKSKQLELFTASSGERVWSGPGPVPAGEIVNGKA